MFLHLRPLEYHQNLHDPLPDLAGCEFGQEVPCDYIQGDF